MIKIIHITKCEECPYFRCCGLPCRAIDETGTSRNAIITDPSKIKDNCPLEDGE